MKERTKQEIIIFLTKLSKEERLFFIHPHYKDEAKKLLKIIIYENGKKVKG